MYYNTIRGQNNKLPPFLQAICEVKGQINNLQREYKQPIRSNHSLLQDHSPMKMKLPKELHFAKDSLQYRILPKGLHFDKDSPIIHSNRDSPMKKHRTSIIQNSS